MSDWRDEKIVDLIGNLFSKMKYRVLLPGNDDGEGSSLEELYDRAKQSNKENAEWIHSAIYDKADNEACDKGIDYILNTPKKDWDSEKGNQALDAVSKHAAMIAVDGVKNVAYGGAGLLDKARDIYLNAEDKNKSVNAVKKSLGEKREFGVVGNVVSAALSDLIIDTALNTLMPGSGVAKRVAANVITRAEKSGINTIGYRHGTKTLLGETHRAGAKSAVAYGNSNAEGNKPEHSKEDAELTMASEMVVNPFVKRAYGRKVIGLSSTNKLKRMTRAAAKGVPKKSIENITNAGQNDFYARERENKK